MRRQIYHSQKSFDKYKPRVSAWRRFLDNRKKKKKKKQTTEFETTSNYRGNPFKTKVEKQFRFGLIAKLVLLLTVVIAWLGLLLYLPFFHITQVSYSGLDNISQAEMADYLSENFLDKSRILPFRNYFFVDVEKIQRSIEKDFPVRTVIVKKTFPAELEISLVEKISSLIYDNGSQYFLMDNTGTLIKFLKNVDESEFRVIKNYPRGYFLRPVSTSTTSTIDSVSTTTEQITTSTIHIPASSNISKQFGKYPILYDARELPAYVNKQNTLPEKYITSVITWYNHIKEQGIGEPKYFTLENLGAGIAIETTLAWDIVYQPKDDINTQINNLQVILESNQPQQYVDLRYGERVFWK